MRYLKEYVFRAAGYDIHIDQWRCTAIKAAYCGLPLGLGMLSKVLGLTDKAKLSTGKALIRYFCVPCKPTKTNGGRLRNLPHHAPDKWQDFKTYCINDVAAEMEVGRMTDHYALPLLELQHYRLDQAINDRGVLVDTFLARSAYEVDQVHAGNLLGEIKRLTGVANPNSPAQLTKWLTENLGFPVTSLAKDNLPVLIEAAGEGTGADVLRLRGRASKTSIKKYVAMLNCVCLDERARGLLQFYGANRTGRWAGRLIQIQNLAKNFIDDLEGTRDVIKTQDYELITMMYDSVSSILSQLIRTAFIAKPGHTFAVSDFSAIEARVIAWLANEVWRLEVFKTHGKIYEASAAMMFGVPIESIGKSSPERAKGKVAELALGYQGAIGALKAMGGESMGLSDDEMRSIVKRWRYKNPNIVKMWGHP